MRSSRRSGPVEQYRLRPFLLVVATAVLIVLADQVTKTLAVDRLTNGPVHVLGPFSLDLAYNTGIAFSIGTGLTLPIIVIGLAIVLLLVWFGRGAPNYPASVAIGLVLGGACGNLGDRIFRGRAGSVVDFIHTGFWPTFNLADAAIVVGCAMLVVVFWRHGPTSTPRSSDPQ